MQIWLLGHLLSFCVLKTKYSTATTLLPHLHHLHSGGHHSSLSYWESLTSELPPLSLAKLFSSSLTMSQDFFFHLWMCFFSVLSSCICHFSRLQETERRILHAFTHLVGRMNCLCWLGDMFSSLLFSQTSKCCSIIKNSVGAHLRITTKLSVGHRFSSWHLTP